MLSRCFNCFGQGVVISGSMYWGRFWLNLCVDWQGEPPHITLGIGPFGLGLTWGVGRFDEV